MNILIFEYSFFKLTYYPNSFYSFSKELECEDKKNRWCKRQKKNGNCSNQDVWMKCPKSCDKCGDGKPNI